MVISLAEWGLLSDRYEPARDRTLVRHGRKRAAGNNPQNRHRFDSNWPVDPAFPAQSRGRRKRPAVVLKQGFSPFRELLLCQQWTLFGYVVPFNFTIQFEVELRNGRVVVLRDLVKEHAGKWQPLLFHNERKTQLNLYANRPALRHYFEYLIWLNEIDPSQVVRRIIYLRYRDVLSRDYYQMRARGDSNLKPSDP